MSSNVGLSTPRGSGTSGYVQRNLAHLKPRDQGKSYSTDLDSLKHRQRQPDKDILEHDRKREIEVKVFELRDLLEDEGYVVPLLLTISSYAGRSMMFTKFKADFLSSWKQSRRRRNRGKDRCAKKEAVEGECARRWTSEEGSQDASGS